VYAGVVTGQSVVFVATFWATVAGCAQRPDGVPVITVCEALRSLSAWRGKTVVVVGLAGWTFEGTFMHEKCEPDDAVLIQGRRWASMMAIRATESTRNREATEASFPADEALLWRRLREVNGFASDASGNFWGSYHGAARFAGAPVV